jgi:chemotaxis protein methyltransferase CheR
MGIAAPQFDYLRRIVRQHSAIVIDADKDYLAESRLAPVAENEGFSSIEDLILSLERQNFGTLHRKVVDAMTNNETWFFRDYQPYDALKQQLIPELLTRNASTRKISFWSAACSSGQEPYSIAISLRENFALPGWTYSIVATDLADHILQRARLGSYSQMEVSRGLPTPLLTKYFLQDELQWRLKPEIRNMVDFRGMNLIGSWPHMQAVDVLFLRNVLIYFDVETKKAILEKARKVLRPNGYMFLGAAETTLNLDDNFERVPFGRTAYYRLRS